MTNVIMEAIAHALWVVFWQNHNEKKALQIEAETKKREDNTFYCDDNGNVKRGK